jgi:5-dehydro-2-deoxygluconokinase
VRDALRGFGVDDRFVGTHPSLKTPVVFCEIHPPDHFPLLFYRDPQAPDMTLSAAELDLDAIRAARVFWTTGTGLSAEPSRAATLAALSARDGGITVHDLDHRPMFWADESEAGHWARAALKHATVAVGNQDEVAVAVRTRDPYAASAHLLELGVDVAIVKRGPKGVLARTRDELVEVPPVPVDVVCGLGAGDAFGGALVHGLLAGWPLERTIALANAAGAYVAARLACADAMPALEDIEPQEVRT